MWQYQGNNLCNLPNILIYFKKSALFSLPSPARHRELRQGRRVSTAKKIKKQLCVLCVLYIERKNKYIKKRGVWGVSPHIENCSYH